MVCLLCQRHEHGTAGRGACDACGLAYGLSAGLWTRNPLSASLLCHSGRASRAGRSSFPPPTAVVLSASFPTQRVSIILTFAVSTGLALFPWVVSQAYPTPNPQACLLQAKRVQQELNQPFFNSPRTHTIWVRTPPLAAKHFV